jgi:hypothetical protein
MKNHNNGAISMNSIATIIWFYIQTKKARQPKAVFHKDYIS